MEFILISDSFKRTLSSSQIYAMMDKKIKKHFSDGRTVSVPVADGEEGSMDASIVAVSSIEEYVMVKNPYFEDMESYFGLIDKGQAAVIEMASCAELPLVEDRKDPRLTTAYGVGQLILAAAGKRIKKIIVGLEGSSINNGGYGATVAAGVRFCDRGGREFIPIGRTIVNISRINPSGRDSLLEQVEVVTIYDIDSPMYGPAGTSFIFDPQKRADEAMILQLGEGIGSLSGAIAQATGTDMSQVPGTRIAGATGAGMTAFFGSEPRMGIQTVLDTVKFDKIIGDADYTLTGGGKLDSQSLRGKIVIGIAKRANKQAKAVIAVVDGVDDDEIGKAYDMGVTAVLPVSRLPQDFSASRHRSQGDLAYTVDNIVRPIKTGQRGH